MHLVKISILSFFSILLFISCGTVTGDSNTNKSDNVGIFVDVPVAGLEYYTESLSGFTNLAGEVEYKDDENCTFKIGNLILGSMPCASIMSAYKIGGTINIHQPTQKTKNISRILQTLDDKTEDSTTITINSNVSANIELNDFNISSNSNDLNISELIRQAVIVNSVGNYTDKTEDLAMSAMKSYFQANHPTHLESSLPYVEESNETIVLDNNETNNTKDDNETVVIQTDNNATDSNTTDIVLLDAKVNTLYIYELNVSSFNGTSGGYRVIDISSKLNKDAILNKPLGNEIDSSEDGLDAGGAAYFTKSFDSTNDGLIDNGEFPSNTYHENIKLAFSNEDNGNNVILVTQSTKDDITMLFDIYNHTYDDVYIYGASGNGDVTLKVKYYYDDSSIGETTLLADSREIIVPDWYNDWDYDSVGGIISGTEDENMFYVVNELDRYAGNHTSLNDDNDPAIFGFKIPVEDKTKVVDKIEIIPVNFTSSSTQVAIFGVNIQDDELLSTSSIKIKDIVNKPDWLKINGFTFKGTPSSSDVKTTSFTFVLTDGNINNDIHYTCDITVK